jgi:2'-5' RNA ligase
MGVLWYSGTATGDERDGPPHPDPYGRGMTNRALVIFPEMDTEAIERFRDRWDPLGRGEVPAHLTIAFPFEWPGTADDLAERLAPVVAVQPAFAFRLTSLEVWADEYLFLLLGEGHEQVRRLHEAVYRLEIPGMHLTGPFEPHLTVGRCPAESDRTAAVRAAQELPLPLTGAATSLTLYRLGDGGERVRERDLPLGG